MEQIIRDINLNRIKIDANDLCFDGEILNNPFLQNCLVRKIQKQFEDDGISEFDENLIKLFRVLEEIHPRFHCYKVFHEFLMRLIVDLDPSNVVLRSILEDSKDEFGCFWLKTFSQSFDDQCNDGNHCLCPSFQCLCRILMILDENNWKISEKLDDSINSILNSHQTFSRRCSTFEFLKFCIFLSSLKRLILPISIKFLCDSIKSNRFLKEILKFFHKAKDFCGNDWILSSVDELPPTIATEFLLDCPMIRSYIKIYIKYSSKDEKFYSSFMEHLSSLRHRILNDSCEIYASSLLIDWIIEIFASEDADLFDLLIDILVSTRDRLQETHFLIHRMFSSFIVRSLHQDASVLLEMLCTEKSTALKLLEFLIMYLKIFPSHTETKDNIFLKPIEKILGELSIKIAKLDSKNLFPYNVKPLLKLLNFRCK